MQHSDNKNLILKFVNRIFKLPKFFGAQFRSLRFRSEELEKNCRLNSVSELCKMQHSDIKKFDS
jgi:hypothetical protein